MLQQLQNQTESSSIAGDGSPNDSLRASIDTQKEVIHGLQGQVADLIKKSGFVYVYAKN